MECIRLPRMNARRRPPVLCVVALKSVHVFRLSRKMSGWWVTKSNSHQSARSMDPSEAYIRSQAGEGWALLPDQYDDSCYAGANMDRPALRRLLSDI